MATSHRCPPDLDGTGAGTARIRKERWGLSCVEALAHLLLYEANGRTGGEHEAAVIRLVGAVLADTNDEWQTDERRYLSESSMALLLYPDRDTGQVAAINSSE
jgi:hypothetical protein